MKKLLGIVVLGLFLSGNAEASMKYLFKTKIKCRYNYVTMGTLTNPYELVEKFGKMEFMAFDKKNLWVDWDDINQDFKYKFDVEFFGKDKIIARVGNYKTIELDRINGKGSRGLNRYIDCKEIRNLPKKNVKQKF